MKVAIISCYDQADYIRARVLRPAFAAAPGVETIIVKNKHRGLLRYLEVPLKILKVRFTKRPDAYVITFRGYEMLSFVLCIKGSKPLIFDEYINAAEYLYEHHRLTPGSVLDTLFLGFYRFLLRRCRFVLADTEAHAYYSAELSKLDTDKFRVIPIGTDETIFYPRPRLSKQKDFTVFYYGAMKRLHGLDYVLKAAIALADNPHITFVLGGDKGESEAACKAAIKKGARITYMPWVPFEDIPVIASQAGLTLGGPFGKTLQSQFVITTKTFQFLACQAPVLLGRNKVNEGFKDKQNCLVVPLEDATAITNAIRWAYDHPRELKKIAAEGRTLYKTHFSKDIINRNIADMVKELR